MPKRIEQVEDTLLTRAKALLLSGGYDALTIRAVARDAGIAVGTVYNYFPSKEVLVARVILEDWKLALNKMEQDVAAAPDAVNGLEQIHRGLAAFSGIYTKTWSQYAIPPKAASKFPQRHELLLAQLEQMIRPLLERFGCLFTLGLPRFLAQTLLSASSEKDGFDKLVPILQKLLQTNE